MLAVLFWAALSHRVYMRTLPYHVLARVFGEDDEAWAAVVVRKLYSVVAFALVGFVTDKALPPTRRRALRAALIVAGFSAAIEIAQKLHQATEGPLSNVVDVLCGALGGWLAVIAAEAVAHRRTRSVPD